MKRQTVHITIRDAWLHAGEGAGEVTVTVDCDESLSEIFRSDLVGAIRAMPQVIANKHPRFSVLHARVTPTHQVDEPEFLPEESQ